MSAEAQGWVWRNSPYKDATLVVHLAIADVANDAHDFKFWMTMSNLAAKSRCSTDTARRAVHKMLEDGFLELIDSGGGRSRPATYRFKMPNKDSQVASVSSETNPGESATLSEPETLANGRETLANPLGAKNSKNTKTDTNSITAPAAPTDSAAKKRKPNPLWDAVEEVFGPASTDSRKAMYGRAVKELKAAGATPEMIVERGREAKARFSGKMTVTPMAMLKHWDDLAVKKAESPDALKGNAQAGKNFFGFEYEGSKDLAAKLGARVIEADD